MGCKSSKATDVASNEPFDAPKNGYRAADIPIGGTPVGKVMSSPKTAAALNGQNGGNNGGAGGNKAEESQQQANAASGASSASQVQVVVSDGLGQQEQKAGSSTATNSSSSSAGSLQTPSQQTQPPAADAKTAADQKPADGAAGSSAAAAAVPGSDVAVPSAEEQEEVITGVLEKKGAIGTAGQLRWTERYVVLNKGIMTYHKSVGDYESNKPPRKNNRVELRLYAVLPGEPPEAAIIDPSRAGKDKDPDDAEYSRAFYLRSLPFEGCPSRIWEFRAIEREDLKDWIDVFEEQGCTSAANYNAIVTAGLQGNKDLLNAVLRRILVDGANHPQPDHPVLVEKRAFVAPLSPAEVVAAATASEKASLASALAAKGVTDASSSSSSAAGADAAASSSTTTGAAAAASAEAATAAALVSASGSSAAALLPYNSCNMVLTPALTSDLCDPTTDSQDPHCVAAYIKKKGEKHLDGYKSRWVVLKRGFMMYWDVEAKRARGSRPNHGNYIPLAAYNIVIPASKEGFYIRLDPIKGGPADGSTPSLNNSTGADSPNVKGRVWDLQVVGKTEADRQFWVDKLMRHGAIKGGQLPLGVAGAAGGAAGGGGASVVAGATPGEPAVPVAPNGYDYRTRPHIWEICQAEDGRLYFYNLKYDASQWDLPTSDELSEAEANTIKSLQQQQAAAAAAKPAGSGSR